MTYMNMKLIKYLTACAFAFLAVACTEEVVKSDYDNVQDSAKVPASATSISVTDTSVVSVTVKGSVPADSSITDWGVVYYTTEMLQSGKFLVQSAKDSKYTFNFTVSLSGLVPNTEYICKTYAMNHNGIVYGKDMPFKTKPAKSIPFELKATDPASVWTSTAFVKIDADGDGQNWLVTYVNTAKTEIGLKSYSWYNAVLKPNNFIVLPPIKLGTAAANFMFDVEAGDATYFGEKYKVVISTTPILTAAQAAAAKVLYTETLASSARTTKTVAIPSSYSGKVVWIGLCHFDCTDMYYIAITSIKVY